MKYWYVSFLEHKIVNEIAAVFQLIKLTRLILYIWYIYIFTSFAVQIWAQQWRSRAVRNEQIVF
jgi:hypothetical protein